MRFPQQHRQRDQTHQRVNAEQPENPLPGGEFEHQPTHNGGQQRRGGHHHYHERHHARRLRAVETISYDRPRHDRAGRRAKALNGTRGNEHADRLRQGTGDGGDQIQAEAEIQYRPPPVAIGERTVGQLAGRQTQEE